jgi:D-glucosaminate-6-phosphate ammonia-lyase
MEANPFLALGLPRVINAAGKMTALGGTAMPPPIAHALETAASHHVELAALRRVAGETIARRTGAEAASITSGAAAGIAIGVAAMITGSDEALVARLPDTAGLANGIVLQAGHDVHFGATVGQMIRLGGGRPITVGSHDSVTAAALSRALDERTAGLVYVCSHHTRQQRGVALDEFLEIAHSHDLPVLVDAAAEEDLEAYVAAGADLVTYSGGKAIGGPTVGFIAGCRTLVAACELQNRGIARAMKVGKEQILGLLAALDRYPAPATWPARLEALQRALEDLPAVRVTVEQDLAGRDIRRLGLRMDSVPRLRLLVAELRAGDPAIYTRDHQIAEGLVLFDLREVADADVPIIARRIREALDAPAIG